MNDFSKGNPYNFRRSEDEEWFLIHDSAVTNTNPNSIVEVTIDTTPICKNMTDREFRNIVLSLRDDAVSVIRQRLQELSSWSPSARSRVRTWFGSDDDATRQTLINGLNALAPIMSELKATNFVRPDSYMDRATGCVPNRKNITGEVAHVCRPDTATHTIAIQERFCTLDNKSAATMDSKQLTIVHECTHFIDTFGSVDYNNTYGQFLSKRLAQSEPKMAIQNADNISWYILCVD